jgi:hypothetical protein
LEDGAYIKVGIGDEKDLLLAGEGVVEEVELLLAADEDLIEVVGVEAWRGGASWTRYLTGRC